MLMIQSRERESFEAWMENDVGESLREHKPKYNTDRDAAAAYVKSSKDEKFRVCIKVDDTDRALCCDLTIDGQCVASSFLGKWNYYKIDRKIVFEDLDGGPGQIIPLRFGQTEVHGASPAKMGKVMVATGTTDENMLEGLGSIKIELYPVKIFGTTPHYKHRIKERTTYHPEKVHPLKAHSAKYVREPSFWGGRTYCKTERVNPGHPIATFTFKYRCQVALELMEILQPKFPEIDVDISNLHTLTGYETYAEDLKYTLRLCRYQEIAKNAAQGPENPHCRKYVLSPAAERRGAHNDD